MRTTDTPEPQPLGKKIEPPKPAPTPVRVADGVFKDEKGKLFTDKPVPPQYYFFGVESC